MDIDEATITAMAALGWATFGSFGFACSYVPGQQDDATFKADVLVPLFGIGVNSPMAAPMRRLYFEAYTVAAMEMRARNSRSSTDPPRTMPQPEREHRFQALRALLPGMMCTGVHEPSDSLVDKMAQMLEQGRLVYVPWQERASKDQERENVRTDRFWKPDASGHMKETVVPCAVNADTSTDLKLIQALVRRGMAFHMAHLMKFDTHEKLKNLLMGELAREPPSPEYSWVSVAQLVRADKEVFRLLNEACRAGLTPDPAGVRPLDACMNRILDATSVRVMLLHLPATGVKRAVAGDDTAKSQAVDRADGHKEGEGKSAMAKKRARKAAAKAAGAGHQVAAATQRKPERAKGSGKNDRVTFTPMPLALRGLNAKTPDGSSICFAYNLPSGCRASQPCPKGKHVCAKCGAAHSFQACTAAGGA